MGNLLEDGLKTILGSGPEKPAPKVYGIKDINSIKKFSWTDNVEYQYSINGKIYRFRGDGMAGAINSKGEIIQPKPTANIIQYIKVQKKTLDEKARKDRLAREKADKEAAKRKSQNQVKTRREYSSIDEEVQENNKLVFELQTLLKTADIQTLNTLLEEKQSDYEDIVQTSGFKKQLKYALENYEGSIGVIRERYVIIIQLQARFGLKLGNTIDGIRGKECDQVKIQQTKEALNVLQKSVAFKTLYDNLTREINKGGNTDKYLSSNYDQYVALVKSDWFLNKVKQAAQDPKNNPLYLQLYGRFALNDVSVVVDGMYGFQTKSIAERYLLAEAKRKDAEGLAEEEKEKESMKRRLDSAEERYNSAPQEKKVAMDISQMFNESMSKEDNDRYFKLLGLSDEKVDQFLTDKEKSKKPEKVQKIREKKKVDLYKKAMKTAQVSCISFIQGVFNTTIDIKDVKPIELSADIDPQNGAKAHDGQNIDFNISPNGIPLKVCYNLSEGTIAYESSFDVTSGGINLGKPGYESTVLSGAPSLMSLMEQAKGEINTISGSGNKARKEAIRSIKSIAEPRIGLDQRQSIEKMVAREDCMKSIRELTGYDIPFDLPKGTYQNSQLYALYDMFDRTFKNPKTTAQDIYNFKYNIVEKFKSISAEYLNPQTPKFDNLRKRYLSENKLKQDKQDVLSAKLDTQPDKSLSFYSLFNQFLKSPTVGETDPNYRVLDFAQMESYINKYYQLGYLPDSSMVATIEDKEKKDLEKTFEASLNKVM